MRLGRLRLARHRRDTTACAGLQLRDQERFVIIKSRIRQTRALYSTCGAETVEHELSFPRPLLSVLVVSLQFVSRLATS